MSSLPNPFASSTQQPPISTFAPSPSSAASDSNFPSSAPLFTAGGSAVLTQSPNRRTPGTPIQLYHRPAKPVSENKIKQDAVEAEELRQRVKAAFDRWDVNHDGAISVDDLAAVLHAAQSPVTADELREQFIRPVDANHNGKIDWTEFETAYTHKLRRDRLQPPDDLIIQMEQDLHRKQHAAEGRMGAVGSSGGQEGWKVGDTSGTSGDSSGSSMQQ